MLRSTVAFQLMAPAVALTWTQLPDAPWSTRSDTCGGVLNGKIVIAGGHGNGNYTNDVWLSPDGGASWQQVLSNAPWAARSYHSCVVLPDDRMLLVAGHAEKEWFNDVWISGPSGDVSTWTMVTKEAPWVARAAGSLQYQASTGKVYYMAGSDGVLFPGSGAKLFNDVWASGDNGATWDLMTDAAAWEAREGFTGQSSGNDVVIAGTSLAVMGGEKGYLPADYFGDIWTSDDGASWTRQKRQAEWTGNSSGSEYNQFGRSGHIVAQQRMPDGSATLWLAGGFLGRSDVWCLGGVQSAADLARPWTRVANTSSWPGRYDHMLVVVGDQLVMFGGENSPDGFSGPFYNDVWTADLEPCGEAALTVVV